MFDDEQPTIKRETVIGEDLYDFSVSDLEERIAILEDEIERVRKAMKEKQQGLSAADAVFGKS